MDARQLGLQGHRLIQFGALLFLLACVEGFLIRLFPAPMIARSVHTLGGISGVTLIALGLIWPRLRLNRASASAAFWTLLYSTFATIALFFLAALWRAGASVVPIASQGYLGSAAQESALRAIAYTAGPTALIAFSLILWGLRGRPND